MVAADLVTDSVQPNERSIAKRLRDVIIRSHPMRLPGVPDRRLPSLEFHPIA